MDEIQVEIKIIREKISHGCEDRERVELLNTLSGLVRQFDLAEARALADEALALAGGIAYEEGMAVSLLRIGNCYRTIGDLATAKQYLEDAKRELERFPERRQARMEAWRDLGLLHSSFNEIPQALELFQHAISLADGLDNSIYGASVRAYKGMLHVRLGEYSLGFEMQREALAIATPCGDRMTISMILHNIATIYTTLHDHESALDYMNQSLETLGDLSPPIGRAVRLNGIGLMHRLRLDTDQALRYHHQALAIARETGAREVIAAILGDLGSTYGTRGDYQSSIEYFSGSLALAEEENNDVWRSCALCGIGTTYFHLGDFDRAIENLEPALALARASHLEAQEGTCCECLSSIYESRGDIENALAYHKQWATIRLVQEGRERFNAVALVELRMKIEIAEREREALRVKNERLREEMQRSADELAVSALQLVKHIEFIDHFKLEIRKLTTQYGGDARIATALVRLIEHNSTTDHSWQMFEQQFRHIHNDFMGTLSGRYATLTPTELKICSLLKMNLSNKEIGSLLSIADRTVDTHRTSIRRKLGLKGGDNLTAFLVAV
ncbi:MAG: photosystem assembly protein Ycf3 [Chlorobi bacterium]|nr:photosystem assembly protein Ycf3 [Chlorobiota bacterium]